MMFTDQGRLSAMRNRPSPVYVGPEGPKISLGPTPRGGPRRPVDTGILLTDGSLTILRKRVINQTRTFPITRVLEQLFFYLTDHQRGREVICNSFKW